LEWGRRVEVPLSADATTAEVEVDVVGSLVLFIDPSAGTPVSVTCRANGFAFKWRVVILMLGGYLDPLRANGDLITNMVVRVATAETKKGPGNLHAGNYC
jgi:hypothetical protein